MRTIILASVREPEREPGIWDVLQEGLASKKIMGAGVEAGKPI